MCFNTRAIGFQNLPLMNHANTLDSMVGELKTTPDCILDLTDELNRGA